MEFAKPAIRIEDTRQELDTEAKFKLLQTFDFNPSYPQLIEINTREFTAVCPGTGLPDIATIDLAYIPNGRCLELKSLKYYWMSFRNDGIFQEPVTDLMFEHFQRALKPHYMKLTVRYNTRGGIDTVTSVELGNRNLLNPTAS